MPDIVQRRIARRGSPGDFALGQAAIDLGCDLRGMHDEPPVASTLTGQADPPQRPSNVAGASKCGFR